MSERTMDTAAILHYVAACLQAEDALEVPRHWEHECYAGMLVMQDLILALYPEIEIPTQRTNLVKEIA